MSRSVLLAVTLVLCRSATASAERDPLAPYGQAWTAEIAWHRTVTLTDVPGDTWDARLRDAQASLGPGGGVVDIPPGRYAFRASIRLHDRVVLRGVPPRGVTDARQADYSLPTHLVFPRYRATFTGAGTPLETAFKGIILADPNAVNCGLLNLALEHGHIELPARPGHSTGRNRFVVGCLLTNAAVADAGIPDARLGQHPWQRFTARHHAAVAVQARANILVANNRLPRSGRDNFRMDDFVVKGTRIDGVVFDYDNRPGLYVNDTGLGGAGANGPDGTPATHPGGFRRGIRIQGNYVFCTGRCAISFSGDGTVCRDNVIRFADRVWRPTCTGRAASTGSSTNDNRAVQMRGWRWTVANNDYRVYRNLCLDRNYRINDGEGLMHEDHANSTVRDSRVIDNRGNSYLSIYKTGGIDGLIVRGNTIRTGGGIEAIYVVADRNRGRYPCRNVTIEDNVTAGSGIRISGAPAAGNVVRRNRHEGPGGVIINRARARLESNVGYTVEAP